MNLPSWVDGKPRCWYCHQEMEEMAVSKKNDKWVLSGKWAFHMFSVHGIPKEMFPDLFEDVVGKLEEILI